MDAAAAKGPNEVCREERQPATDEAAHYDAQGFRGFRFHSQARLDVLSSAPRFPLVLAIARTGAWKPLYTAVAAAGPETKDCSSEDLIAFFHALLYPCQLCVKYRRFLSNCMTRYRQEIVCQQDSES